MTKQSTLNSKVVITIVDHGGHFWQWFNLSNVKGYLCQMDAGKPQSPDSKTHPATSVNPYTEQLGGKEREETKLLLHAFAAFHSHHGHNFRLQSINGEGFCVQIAEIHIH